MCTGEMLCTNFCDDIMAELKTWYGRSQKDELTENNSKASFQHRSEFP